jgi:hypothetical protein
LGEGLKKNFFIRDEKNMITFKNKTGDPDNALTLRRTEENCSHIPR